MTTEFGTNRIRFGLPPITSSGLPNNGTVFPEQNDELIRMLNRVVTNLELAAAPVESVVRFILLAASAEGIQLEWNQKENKFRRVQQ